MCATASSIDTRGVTLADTETPGDVVRPQRGSQQTCEPSIDHTTVLQHRHEEGEHVYEVRGVLEHALPFVQRFVDQPELALLQVAEAAVHQLRALRRRTGGEVVAFHERGVQPARWPHRERRPLP